MWLVADDSDESSHNAFWLCLLRRGAWRKSDVITQVFTWERANECLQDMKTVILERPAVHRLSWELLSCFLTQPPTLPFLAPNSQSHENRQQL